MKNKLALAACALLTIGSAMAAETPDNNPPTQSTPSDMGFGGGLSLSQGGGSASGLGGGFGSPASSSGVGTQSFGGGFTAGAGSGPLSPPAAGGGAMGGGGGPQLF